MIKNRKLDHLGFYTPDVDKTAAWYCDVLGFRVIGDFVAVNGTKARFIDNGAGVCYELVQPKNPNPALFNGKIDHISYVSEDIEADYQYCKDQGYDFTTNGVQDLKTFWEKGARYFKIKTATGEEVEFCQILK